MASASASKELFKHIVNKFVYNGHSCESSNLIVKYFIGFTDSKISHYQEQMNKKEVISFVESRICFVSHRKIYHHNTI